MTAINLLISEAPFIVAPWKSSSKIPGELTTPGEIWGQVFYMYSLFFACSRSII
jgi:hypothetical protein